jgi:hypothetical protein
VAKMNKIQKNTTTNNNSGAAIIVPAHAFVAETPISLQSMQV